jgi:glutamate/aspartate transport system substrate-binding protein
VRSISVEPIAIMMRKDDPALKKLADDTIKDMIKSGDMAKLYDKWFVQPIPPKNTRVGLPVSDAPRLPGPTRTTSPWKTTPRSNASLNG